MLLPLLLLALSSSTALRENASPTHLHDELPRLPSSLERYKRSGKVTARPLLVSSNPPDKRRDIGTYEMLIVCSLVAFSTDSSSGMLGSFFPTHLNSKGIGTSAIGTMLGFANGIGILVAAPFMHIFVERVGGAPWAMLYGTLLFGICRFALATLRAVERPAVLLWSSGLLMLLQCLGDTACDTAASSLVMLAAPPEQRAQAQSLFLNIRSFGYLLAPPTGGFLYSAGGFTAPFVFSGCLCVAACILALRVVTFRPDGSGGAHASSSRPDAGGMSFSTTPTFPSSMAQLIR